MRNFLTFLLMFFLVTPGIAEEPQASERLQKALSRQRPELTQKETTQTCLTHLNYTGLALEMYYSDFGHYPEKLEQLTPDYLKKLLTGPEGKGFVYQRDGENWSLSFPGSLPDCPEGYPRANSETGVEADKSTHYPLWAPKF